MKHSPASGSIYGDTHRHWLGFMSPGRAEYLSSKRRIVCEISLHRRGARAAAPRISAFFSAMNEILGRVHHREVLAAR